MKIVNKYAPKDVVYEASDESQREMVVIAIVVYEKEIRYLCRNNGDIIEYQEYELIREKRVF